MNQWYIWNATRRMFMTEEGNWTTDKHSAAIMSSAQADEMYTAARSALPNEYITAVPFFKESFYNASSGKTINYK